MQGERNMRMQNARFGSALNSMTQGLCMFDAGRRVVVMNARFIEIYSIPPEFAETCGSGQRYL